MPSWGAQGCWVPQMQNPGVLGALTHRQGGSQGSSQGGWEPQHAPRGTGCPNRHPGALGAPSVSPVGQRRGAGHPDGRGQGVLGVPACTQGCWAQRAVGCSPTGAHPHTPPGTQPKTPTSPPPHTYPIPISTTPPPTAPPFCPCAPTLGVFGGAPIQRLLEEVPRSLQLAPAVTGDELAEVGVPDVRHVGPAEERDASLVGLRVPTVAPLSPPCHRPCFAIRSPRMRCPRCPQHPPWPQGPCGVPLPHP